MRLFITVVFFFNCFLMHSQVPAFPGAEGGGKYCTGGRGGRVLIVENLNNKGDGSFRDAIEAEGPRIIVFRVSGTIELEKTIHIKNGDLTIAGQTAPGDGICLKNFGVRVDADNVIIRYIRVRPGAQEDEENDAISGTRNKNLIIDHCSFSWANDEVASFYDNENFTMQWCIISESLYLSSHHKGAHGYGGIWGGYMASFHHNLISDHTSRNPRLNGTRYEGGLEQEIVDFRNNLIYNWGFNTIYGGEAGMYNLVNNYFKPGPATRDKVKDRILDLTQVFYNPSINKDTLYSGKFFLEGNFIEGDPEISDDNWNGGVQGKGVDEEAKQRARLDAPVEHLEIPTSDAYAAYHGVLKYAGANKVLDAVDQRIIKELRTGRETFGVSYEGGNNGIIDSPADVGGWPELVSSVPPTDSDRDGMPDSWEKKHDLDPLVQDNNQYTLDAHYTNIEVYINELVEDCMAWTADNGDGTYNNPILHADYSDPDVVRVGEDYYMTASSFNCVPGLPVLHSRDLVNWELIGYALDTLIPEDVFSVPQHGNGVWAPCIRYHNKEYYIYYPDPDFGIYMVKATDPHGPWSDPLLVKGGKGLIDPSPLWDEDGKVYLTYAFAGSRAGIKSVLMVTELSADGTAQIGEDVMVFDGHDEHPTVEGPKFYKRNGYYYIFAPAGGVKWGWQLVLRSRDIYGPYEEKVVMAQGSTDINGPHQGAWIDTPSGEEHWFIHFQDKEAYGRIVHLQPMKWVDGWPVIGSDDDGDGIGEPVLSFRKPDVGADFTRVSPPESDEFNGSELGLQWQWHANPDLYYGFPSGKLGYFRLNCIPRPQHEKGLWNVPNLLLQKLPAEKFTATTRLTFNSYNGTEEAGFVIMGEDYQYISLQCIDGSYHLRVVRCKDARTGGSETVLFSEPIDQSTLFFRIQVQKNAICSFSYSLDGKRFVEVGDSFQARPGRWIGARIGYFAVREGITNDSGTVDIDWIRIGLN